MRYFNPGFVIHPAVRSTWSNADKSSNITLTGGALTATCNNGTVGAVRGTIVRSTGKWYFECLVSTVTGAATGAGLANGTVALGSIGFTASGAFIQYNNGLVYGNGTLLYDNGDLTSGQIVRVAYDSTNHRAWLAVAAGNFNNSGTANPATNTGGADMSGIDGAGLLPCFEANASGDSATLNCGDTSFTYSVPSGFTAWNG